MPDYSKDTYEQTKNKLKTFGTEIGSFNQGTFRKDLAFPVIANIGDASLEGGYCNGVLLDWVRRVLLSEANRDQGQAYLTFHSGALTEGKGAGKRTHKELQGRASQIVQRMGQAWYHSGDMNWVGEEGKPTSISPEEWKKTVSAIDQEFEKQRKEAARKESRKHFGRLVLVESRKTTYPDANQWMGTLLNVAFRPGHCTCVGFNVIGQAGHSVAIWQRRTSKEANDSFYFFDPNYGVYACNILPGKRGLKTALQYLFWKDAKDTPKYANCASAKDQVMSYMIFGPPRLVE